MYTMEFSRPSSVMLLHVIALIAVVIVSCNTAFGLQEETLCINGELYKGQLRVEGAACGPCRFGSKLIPEGKVVISRRCCRVMDGPVGPHPVCEKKLKGSRTKLMCACACVDARMQTYAFRPAEYRTSSGGLKSCKAMKAVARRSVGAY
eukprot:scpid96586/ scgid6789/ 